MCLQTRTVFGLLDNEIIFGRAMTLAPAPKLPKPRAPGQLFGIRPITH